jgi:broad specificity phosphatase PhoE
MHIDLLRHGEPQGGEKYRGHGVDDPLSEKGWQQMWRAVEDAGPWCQIVHSPLLRCREFALALAARDGLPTQEDARWREVGFGTWEGRTREALERDNPGVVARFTHDPIRCRPAGAETLDDFCGRVGAAWDELTAQPAGNILLVVHAGVIRAVLARVLAIPHENLYRLHIGNAARIRIHFKDGRPPQVAL